MIRAFLITALMFTATVQAAATKYVQPGGMVNIAISIAEPNRIAINGDRITSFIGMEGATVETNDPQSGDLFVSPSEVNGTRLISGFLTTESGNTIQIRMQPQKIPTTNTEINLRVADHSSKLATSWERQFRNENLTTWNLAKAVESGMALPGFKAESMKKGIEYRSPSLGPLTARIHYIAIGSEYRADKMLITNTTAVPQVLNERMLNDKYLIGVWLVGAAEKTATGVEDIILAPGETMTAIRVFRNFIY
ncbi:TraK domain-containing protein [Enterovibrio paralichthyis]|uniref:TraK domain-containing protein n=1 Tax=Enterovibrio paralichthyis TaxID=2853805 RepID=UPI001C48595E|nr:type-F conjugative transfer system secretin TraK [Enterovibrio paralichthyis]MBV7300268.1 type-F conjugative transfer system secretin TraK [Enterovibrio paralichthyis]